MFQALPWHAGESHIHSLINPSHLHLDNPTTPALTPHAASLLSSAPLLALGTLDSRARPWSSLWGGEAGVAVPVGGGMIGVKIEVSGLDPVVEGLREGGEKEEMNGKMMSGLCIDLDKRRRVKLFGRVVAGKLVPFSSSCSSSTSTSTCPSTSSSPVDGQGNDPGTATASIQLVVHIEQSLGNCPKYINRRVVVPAAIQPRLVRSSSADIADLPSEAVHLVKKADIFFISTSHGMQDMDTNHRGGSPGFVRIARAASRDDEAPETEKAEWTIVWPEYSGNRLYQTLGNLAETPKAGLCFPDFETGNVLYVTGSTRTSIGNEARAMLPRSNLAVALTIEEARFVKGGLSFRGVLGESSPYNPRVRPLAQELATRDFVPEVESVKNTAKLIKSLRITPTISRFTFSMSNPSASTYTPGQCIALDFSDELDEGYSHMHDEDPQLMNDDFVRTFTVSSPPPPRGGNLADDEIEITLRKVGMVTEWLGRQNVRGGVEVPVKGFGGSFVIKQKPEDEDERYGGENDVIGLTPFVAGGVGITPLLASLPSLDVSRLRLFWTIALADVGLVVDTLQRYPNLMCVTRVFLTGPASAEGGEAGSRRIRELGANCVARRLVKEDLIGPSPSHRWYICVGTGLRKTLLEWLEDREVVYEDFNF